MAFSLTPPFKTPILENSFLSKAWEMFFRELISRQEIIVNEFVTDGVLTAFTLSAKPKDEKHTMAFVNGLYQRKSVYSVAGNTITFAAAPASGWLEVVTYGR